MTIPQLSLFLENRPGHLHRICETLGRANSNILAMTVADTAEFGIVRMIVPDWERAREVLAAAGYVVQASEVIAVEVPDRPGGMAAVLSVLDTAGMNVDYLYAFPERRRDCALVVMRVGSPADAIGRLRDSGYAVASAEEVVRDAGQEPGSRACR